jgi:hypothetical protein
MLRILLFGLAFVVAASTSKAQTPPDVTGVYVLTAQKDGMSVRDVLDVRGGGAAVHTVEVKVGNLGGMVTTSNGTWKVEGGRLVYTCSSSEMENLKGEKTAKHGYTREFNVETNGDLIAILSDPSNKAPGDRYVKQR